MKRILNCVNYVINYTKNLFKNLFNYIKSLFSELAREPLTKREYAFIALIGLLILRLITL